jgi:hypothetical protein
MSSKRNSAPPKLTTSSDTNNSQSNSNTNLNTTNINSPVTYHLYFSSIFSPESFSIFNINEKHSLDGTLNITRVTTFITRLNAEFPFIPRDLLIKIEKAFSKLHHGWCSHAMDLILGDLNLIKNAMGLIEQEKESKGGGNTTMIGEFSDKENMIYNMGLSIESLLDTFDISFRIADSVKVMIMHYISRSFISF